MRKANYESSTLGYRLSNICSVDDRDPTDENYYALAICILTGKASDEALRDMGLRENKPNEKCYKYRKLAEAAFILCSVCKMQRKEAAAVLGTTSEVIRLALREAGVKKDGRFRR